ncbi:MAG: ribonuclease Z [Bacillota bacterium]|nr:ribonuclease Z [Bacillota bacterium]
MLDICLLGTGGMMPLPERWLSSVLLRYNGKMILTDCGEGTQIIMRKAEWGFKEIEAICLTHYHADHVSGLPGLLLTIGNSGREENLVIIGPKGLKNLVECLTVISPQLPFGIELIEIENNKGCEILQNGVIVEYLSVDHNIPCFSYSFNIKRQGKFDPERAKKEGIPQRFWSMLQRGEIIKDDGRTFLPEMVLGEERKGLKVSICTDTRPTLGMADFIRDSDVFICEGMYGEDEKLEKAIEKKHMLFSEAAKLATDGNVKEMWLTHFSPSIKDPEEYLDNAKRIFNNSIAGKDLMCKTLSFTDS